LAARVGCATQPDWDRLLHGQWQDVDLAQVVKTPLEADQILAPQAPQHFDLLGLARAARFPFHA
jgi:hypothetical protein